MHHDKKPAPLLQFRNITVLKNVRQKVLDSVSLTIHHGENVAILGPNGAGKSSLVKTITRRYYPVDKGGECSFRVWGHDDWNVFDLRSTLGIVSDDLQHDCDRDVSGYETVLSGFFGGIGIYNEPVVPAMEKKVGKILSFLEIAHLKDKNMNEMSSGESRRFLIGRALVHDPRALILDEPFSNLDLHAQHKFSDILRKLAQSGTNIILVTQNIHDIIPEITRVIFMKGGKILSDGDKEVMLTPRRIGELFAANVEIKVKDGYYYAFRA